MVGPDEWRAVLKKPAVDVPVPPLPKSSGGLPKASGRTFSFGGQKKHTPEVPSIDESRPATSTATPPQNPANARSRTATSSTSTTVMPHKVDDDGDLDFDLGGEFSKLRVANGQRASAATLKNSQYAVQAPAPRSLTGPRPHHPSPVRIEEAAEIEPPPHSWSSQHSNDQLIEASSPVHSPSNNNVLSPISHHASSRTERQKPDASPEVEPTKPLLGDQGSSVERDDMEDEEARLLKDSLSTVTRFLEATGEPTASDSPPASPGARYRRNDAVLDGDNDLFDRSHAQVSKYSSSHYAARKDYGPPGSRKVMTPAEFERYRKDKERQDRERKLTNKADRDEDEEDNYDDEEDDLEKAKQQAKQRQKQEAHMSVYRQQMMKVTGETGNSQASRSSLQLSFSSPNLPGAATAPASATADASDNSDDEEIPLAILAAHGFPNKNRPPTRLSTMMSNPNLRASQQPSYQRPGSVVGDVPGAGNPRLPAFARNLPQDPFVGAGLVRNPVRESLSFGGGTPAPGQPGNPVPPGGLIGVIANEERNRAMRRGSPHIDSRNSMHGAAGYDPIAGIPPHMMYHANQSSPMLSRGEQTQIQMTQQMQQFMQMQMQFMHMMAGQNGNSAAPHGSGLLSSSMGSMNATGGLSPATGMAGVRGPETRHSFVGNDYKLDLPFARGENRMRTMSMVQPSSASWIQPAQAAGYAPSIRMQGGAYAPSIAPSERSNIGLPGRYRPVSHSSSALAGGPGHAPKSTTMSGAMPQPSISVTQSGGASDDDEEQGWEDMKAKREKRKSLWRSKKSFGGDLGSLIS